MSSESEKIRAERKRQRELKDARQQELSRATSTSERRKIKEKYSESGAESGDERRRQSAIRQIERNDEVYGAGSMLGEYQNESVLDSFYDSDIEPSTPESPSDTVLYPDNDDGSGDGNTFTLDVVRSDNTAGTATFNGSGVNENEDD